MEGVEAEDGVEPMTSQLQAFPKLLDPVSESKSFIHSIKYIFLTTLQPIEQKSFQAVSLSRKDELYFVARSKVIVIV